MKFSHLEFKEVKGVGSIEVDFTPDKKVYAFIGENGVGKTKFLEALFQLFILSSQKFKKFYKPNDNLRPIVIKNENGNVLSQALRQAINSVSSCDDDIFSEVVVGKSTILLSTIRDNFIDKKGFSDFESENELKFYEATVFISAKNRGFIKNALKEKGYEIGSFSKRRSRYVNQIVDGITNENDFSNQQMETNIEQWFISIAQSSNPFQKKQDNREIEIRTVLKLFNEIDASIDPNFMEIGEDNHVFLKVNDQKIQLSHLSTGYASILKIIQSIVSGYGYFTNEQQLQHVRGIVLIDEIESHLHLSWQSKIIPTLKELFPNTTFYITTHSPVVLIQLEEGEAYRLQREDDGVVRSSIIHHPSNISFIDLQKRAFDLDLNKIKREQMSADSQKEANQALLDLINEEAVD